MHTALIRELWHPDRLAQTLLRKHMDVRAQPDDWKKLFQIEGEARRAAEDAARQMLPRG